MNYENSANKIALKKNRSNWRIIIQFLEKRQIMQTENIEF